MTKPQQAPFSPVVSREKYNSKVIEAYQLVSQKVKQLESDFNPPVESAIAYESVHDEEAIKVSSDVRIS